MLAHNSTVALTNSRNNSTSALCFSLWGHSNAKPPCPRKFEPHCAKRHKPLAVRSVTHQAPQPPLAVAMVQHSCRYKHRERPLGSTGHCRPRLALRSNRRACATTRDSRASKTKQNKTTLLGRPRWHVPARDSTLPAAVLLLVALSLAPATPLLTALAGPILLEPLREQVHEHLLHVLARVG